RVVIFGCESGYDIERLASESTAGIRIPCVGMLPPSFIDYVLSRGLADGVMLSGCSEGECHQRFGIEWTKARLARTRDPYLRKRVPDERIETVWAPPVESWTHRSRLADFAKRLETETTGQPGEAADQEAKI
ncbi:MAG: hydrogenase iron-sulfur subunit, partial [Alphaproteobacteria bacterium]|nr:hydrogenase iron-sulfur subunit [Alphaproteobacteria bacterium]